MFNDTAHDTTGLDSAVPRPDDATPDARLEVSVPGDTTSDAIALPPLPYCENTSFIPPEIRQHNVLAMSHPNSDVRATMWRCPVMQGVGESQIYRPDRFEITWNGMTVRAFAHEIHDYQNSHHNWADTARIEAGGYTIQFRVEYTGETPNDLAYYISATQNGQIVLAETRLNAAEGTSR